MKQAGILFMTIMALMLSAGCKKKKKEQPEPKIPEYTITGTILNGTTNARFVNMPLEFDILYRKPWGSQNALHKILGKTLTNDTGGFVFTYLEQDVNGLNNPRIKLVSPQYNRDDIPVNQNFTERLYQSSLGTIKIYLETGNPLGQGDTLYFGYQIKVDNKISIHTDTIVNNINGFYKSLRSPPPYNTLFWGRNYEGYKYSEYDKRLIYVENKLQVEVEGDPIVNGVTLKY